MTTCTRDAGSVCDAASTTGGSHIAAVTQTESENGGYLQVWQAESSPPELQYILDAAISLADRPTAVAWLPSCAVSLAVAVACSGTTQIFTQSHAQEWVSIASLGNLGQPMRALKLAHNGLPIVTADNQLGLVSSLVQAHHSSSSGHPSQLLQIPLEQLVLELAGPLPDYAPAVLALLVARGRMTTVMEAFRHLLAWLKIHDSSTQNSSASPLQQQLLPDVPLDALLDKPHMRALSNLVEALPVSSGSRPDSAHPAGSDDRQQKKSSDSATRQAHQLPTSVESERQASPTTAPADPYAFNADAFGMASGAGDEQEEQQAQPAAKDPFAFDAGAFGMDSGINAEQEEEQAQPQAAAKDTYAFDAGAFGTGQDQEEEEEQPQQPQAPSSDPFAFDAAAFGMSTSQPEEDAGEDEEEVVRGVQPNAAAAADPFAFDPGAFGFSGEEQPQHAAAATASVPASASASTAATDPYAFSADSFGFGGLPAEPQSGQEDEGADQSRPEVAPAEASTSDPFAFNPSAFGMDASPEPDQNSFGEVEPAQHAQQVQSGTDPFAFDPGAFGMGPSMSPTPKQPQSHPQLSKPSSASAAKNTAHRQQAEVSEASSKASLRQSGGKAQGRHQPSSVQIYRPKQMSPATPHPVQLSSSELGDLKKLLGIPLSQAAAAYQEPSSPSSVIEALVDPDPPGPPLPPGLAPQNTQGLLSIAQMLCEDPSQPAPPSQRDVAGDAGQGEAVPGIARIPVDWPALDEAARRAVRAVQLAACSLQSGTRAHATQSRRCMPSFQALFFRTLWKCIG